MDNNIPSYGNLYPICIILYLIYSKFIMYLSPILRLIVTDYNQFLPYWEIVKIRDNC